MSVIVKVWRECLSCIKGVASVHVRHSGVGCDLYTLVVIKKAWPVCVSQAEGGVACTPQMH